MLSIKKIEKNKSNLNIEWSDGERSNFNYFWLRDNCPTAHDKDSNHRMYNILEAVSYTHLTLPTTPYV